LWEYPFPDPRNFLSYREKIPWNLREDATAGRKSWAVFPPNPWDSYLQTPAVLAPPSAEHRLGTDNLGRDVLARLTYGARVSLVYGILFWLGSFLIGIVIGAVQGYAGGRTDFVAERFKELAEIVPFLSVIILVNGLVRSQTFALTLGVVILLSWISISSQVRAQFLSLRRREFCEAAVALGARPGRVIFRHILPNALTPILTLSPLAISAGIATLTILDFLGFGLNPPTPSLGELLSQGRNYLINAPWILLATTGVLEWMLISINLIGEGLRKAFDPRR
jgi:microcin C transport system permease protein